MRFPNTTEELITALDRLFPETIHRAGTSPDEIFFTNGERSVVNFIKMWRDRGVIENAPRPARRGAGRDVRGKDT